MSPDIAPSTLRVNVYDGTRNLIPAGVEILYRVIDGNQKQVYSQYQKARAIRPALK